MDHLNADRFLANCGQKVKCSPELNRSCIWNGSRREEDRLEQVQEFALYTIEGQRAWVSEVAGRDEFKRRSAHYMQSTRGGRAETLLSVARTRPYVIVGIADLDHWPHLLACRRDEVGRRSSPTRSSTNSSR